MTVHPAVTPNWPELQKRLYLLEMDIWKTRQELAKCSMAAVYISPSPPFTEAEAALDMAHSYVSKIRTMLRQAEKENAQ